ncbi:RICIN domain-containing protein [Streptomyces sp. FXJ1.4098]|nr:RICIN domain-containing protein [Streptomyces sp. FXJ1.4098]
MSCDGGTHQLWRKAAVIGGYVTFTNVNGGLCLQVAGASTGNGAALSQGSRSTGANQQRLAVQGAASGSPAGGRDRSVPRCTSARCKGDRTAQASARLIGILRR